MDRTFLLVGALAGFMGVALGAFGAHGLRGRLSPEMLGVFETAVRYHIYHALALVLTASLMGRIEGRAIVAACSREASTCSQPPASPCSAPSRRSVDSRS